MWSFPALMGGYVFPAVVAFITVVLNGAYSSYSDVTKFNSQSSYFVEIASDQSHLLDATSLSAQLLLFCVVYLATLLLVW